MINSFFLYSHKKLISRHNMQPNTLERREHKGKIYVKKYSKINSRSQPSKKSDPEQKNHSDPQHCYKQIIAYNAVMHRYAEKYLQRTCTYVTRGSLFYN